MLYSLINIAALFESVSFSTCFAGSLAASQVNETQLTNFLTNTLQKKHEHIQYIEKKMIIS
jgi:hypothetical protein